MSGANRTLSFFALGTTASVVTEESSAAEAVSLLRQEVDALDLACSRFRSDSELTALNAAPPGVAVAVSGLLFDAVAEGLRAARITGGLVDPTVGQALELIGYDRDFGQISTDGSALAYAARPVPGWKSVTLDRRSSTVRLQPGVRLDLGATAKAGCADRAATRIASCLGVGVLVSLGGDISVAGPPPEMGWSVRISHDHAEPLGAPGPTVAISSGGLATSSTTVRQWRRGGQQVHHVIDPDTSKPAKVHWQTVSVAAASCLDANIASCAAIVIGAAAAPWLEGLGLPARLEDTAGRVLAVAGWPADTVGSIPTGSASC